MKWLLWIPCTLVTLTAFAAEKKEKPLIAPEIVKQFKTLGGSPKALKHLGCILSRQRETRFGLKAIKNRKDASTVERCNKIEGGKAEISIHRDDYALVIDFTRAANARRMFLVPITGEGKVEAYYTGHGRFGATMRNNVTASAKSNSITSLKLFSNKPNSNATATGLLIAGDDYLCKYNGPMKEVTKKGKKGKKRVVKVKADPKHPKYSLVLHGVETEVNDNACQRATVIHGTTKISESGDDEGVHLMSSGCPMVDYRAVNRIVEKLKGSKEEGGAAILAYGPREAALEDNYYCEMRADNQKVIHAPEGPQDDKIDENAVDPDSDDPETE